MMMKYLYVEIKINRDTFFVFDLDDTLFPELDYLKSAYRHISMALHSRLGADIYEEMLKQFHQGANVFKWILQVHGGDLGEIDLAWLLKEYRGHNPSIRLAESTAGFLQKLKKLSVPVGLITDGRGLTQRNKLKALGLEGFFNDIIISEEFGSEKPDSRNYMYFVNKYAEREFYFFGDNTSKDFIVPARLGWKTVCIENQGLHIHSQDLFRAPRPDHVISSFKEIDLA